MSVARRPRLPAALGALVLWSGGVDAQGTSGVELLSLPVGARAVALGEAMAAAGHRVEDVRYNPAALAARRGRSAALSLVSAPDLYRQVHVAAGAATGTRIHLGGSVLVRTFDPIPATDASGTRIGEITPQVVSVAGSAGLGAGAGLRGGVTFRTVFSDIAGRTRRGGAPVGDRSTAFAVDLGLQWESGAEGVFTAGLAALDLGSGLSYRSGSDDDLPARLRFGAAARPLGALGLADGPIVLLLAADGERELVGGGTAGGLGVEILIGKHLAVRSGGRFGDGTGQGMLGWIGIGVEIASLRLDLAHRLASHPALEREVHATLGLQF